MSGDDERQRAGLTRRALLGSGALAGAALAVGGAALPSAAAAAAASAEPAAFDLEEVTVAELAEGMRSGRWTAKSLVEKYLGRIAAINERGPTLRAVLEIN